MPIERPVPQTHRASEADAAAESYAPHVESVVEELASFDEVTDVAVTDSTTLRVAVNISRARDSMGAVYSDRATLSQFAGELQFRVNKPSMLTWYMRQLTGERFGSWGYDTIEREMPCPPIVHKSDGESVRGIIHLSVNSETSV